jgi:cyclase
MLQTRVIPVLLLKGKGLVKTVKFDRPKYIGDPINAVKLFNDKETDELVFLDIDASKTGRRPDFEMIKNIASECFMPLGYGGGIQNLSDMEKLFNIGIEKVVLNTAALKNMSLISQAVSVFGSQSIVLSVDVQKNIWGKYQIYSHSKTKINNPDIFKFITKAEQEGVGEIMLNAVERDGQMNGYDLTLLSEIMSVTRIPVVICGGAGTLRDLKKAAHFGASGVAAGSLFLFHGPHKAVLINYPSQQDLKILFQSEL